jgi:methionyl-tRNA formyltransferase
MRIVLWIGNEPNQKALANKIHALHPIAGIVTESKTHKKKLAFRKVAEAAYSRIFFPSISKAWNGLKVHYEKHFPHYPQTEILDVENINSDAAFNFTKNLNPDLILVSGTRLVKEKMLSIKPSLGILNLHTGLSPYVKGGPNCTNWCIATGEFHLIGNTVMWIDAGIDSGNILTTEATTFSGDESLPQVHLKVMEHAHQLYIKALEAVLTGNRNSVQQSSITAGKTYYSNEWNLKKQIDLIRNFKKFRAAVKSGEIEKKLKAVVQVGLSGGI